MPIPTTVSDGLISGVVGTLSNWGPMRAVTAVLDSDDETNNVFGRAFTYKDESVESVQAGGDGAFAGILVHPEAYKLGPYMDNGSVGEFADMAEIFVEVAGAENAGFKAPIYYDENTGELTAVEADGTLVPNAEIRRHLPSAETPNLVLIRLTN